MPESSFFNSNDLDKIAESVKKAEKRSGTEIVPVFAKQSSFYEFIFWRAGFLGSALAAIALLILFYATDAIIYWPPAIWLLSILSAGLLSAILLLAFPRIKRLFIGDNLMEQTVWEQAYLQFMKHELSDTPDRTGVMVFASQFEKRFVVLGDRGLSQYVPQEIWDEIVVEYVEVLRTSGPAKAICQVIEHCGEIIAESGASDADTDGEKGNQFGDHLREEK